MLCGPVKKKSRLDPGSNAKKCPFFRGTPVDHFDVITARVTISIVSLFHALILRDDGTAHETAPFIDSLLPRERSLLVFTATTRMNTKPNKTAGGRMYTSEAGGSPRQ